MNDVVECLGKSVILFADDTMIYASDSSHELAAKKLQDKVNTLMLWTRKSELTVNAAKCRP